MISVTWWPAHLKESLSRYCKFLQNPLYLFTYEVPLMKENAEAGLLQTLFILERMPTCVD